MFYLDYYEVLKDIQRSAKARPLRATLYGISTLIVLNLFRTNEGLGSYNGEVISACNRVGAVTESSRNPESAKFVQNIGELNCFGLLRQIDLGFSTVIYKADSSPQLALFRYNCPYLKPTIKEFLLNRIVDFGISGHWLMLESKMRDYDVNDEEYQKI